MATSAASLRDGLMKVPVTVRVVLARRRMSVRQLIDMGPGSEISVDRRVGDPVELYVGDQLIGRGDLVKLDNDDIGVSLTELSKVF